VSTEPRSAEPRSGGKRIGYVVVTYDQSRRPFAGFVYDSPERAAEDRDGMERNSRTAASGERHVVAEVIELDAGGPA
jgi:hypothetical protein